MISGVLLAAGRGARFGGDKLHASPADGRPMVLASLAPQSAAMRFMDVRDLTLAGAACIVSRSGYSGEDGFEISVPNDHAEALARALIAHEAVWQLRVVARQARRRIRDSEAPQPPWMTAWLGEVDRLCARWLSDAAAAGAEAVPQA